MANPSSEDTVGRVMSSPVITVKSTDNLALAARKMVRGNIGSVMVLDGRKVAGIVTERDVTKQAIKGGRALKKPVKNVMSKVLVTATRGTSIQDAFELMLKNKVRRLPVLESGNLVGIVTEKDLMRWVLRVSYEPNIPPHIKAILESR